jgi:hypothetical protein
MKINLKLIVFISIPDIIGNIIAIKLVAPVIPVYNALFSLSEISSRIPLFDIFKAAIEIPAIINID